MTNFQKPTASEPTEDKLRIKLEKTKWGKTFTTDFLIKADKNTRITYLNLQGYFEMLEGVGDIFMAASDTVDYSDYRSLFTRLLLVRAGGNYFASVRLSSSCQLSESYVLLRACIENALYAFNIYSNPELAEVWNNRHKDDESKRKSVNLFKPSTIIRNLEQVNQSLGRDIKMDYEQYIDFGAHPNRMSVGFNLNVNGGKLSLGLFNARDGIFQGSLAHCAKCGLNAIKIFNLIFPDDFKKFNAEQRIQAIQAQMGRIAPEIRYKLKAKSPPRK